VVGHLRDGIDVFAAEVSSSTHRLAELERAVEQARADRLEFATDLEIKRALGLETFRAGCAVRAASVEKTEAAYRAEAARVGGKYDLPFADELDDPDQLQRALRAAVSRVCVERGRGPLADRVYVEWSDNAAEALAA
jgi:hypothetical protein